MSNTYSIHGLVTASVDIDHGFIPDYFITTESKIKGQPDVRIRQGNVDCSGVEWKRCGTFFFAKRGDALLIDYPNLIFDTKIEIRNLTGNTELIVTDSFDRFGDIDVLFNTILFLKLVQQGHTFVHSGAVNRGGDVTLVSGMRDTGKTSTTLSQFDGEDTMFMSDDLTILSRDGKAYSYPRPIGISPYTLTGDMLSYPGGRLKEWMAKRQTLVLLQDFTRFELTERVDIQDEWIRDQGSLENVFVLNPIEKGTPEIEEISPEQAANKLFETTVEMFDPFRVYSLNFYSYVTDFDKLGVTTTAREIMINALTDTNCYQLNANEVTRYAELVDENIL